MGIRDLLRKVFGRSRDTRVDDSAAPEAAVVPAPQPDPAPAESAPEPKPEAKPDAAPDPAPEEPAHDPAVGERLKTQIAAAASVMDARAS